MNSKKIEVFLVSYQEIERQVCIYYKIKKYNFMKVNNLRFYTYELVDASKNRILFPIEIDFLSTPQMCPIEILMQDMVNKYEIPLGQYLIECID